MNFRELAEDLGLEEEEYLELIELFIEIGMSDLDELYSAIEEADPEQAANAAHSLRGSAANLGLMELAEIAEEIEGKARSDRLEGTAPFAQALQAKLNGIAEAFRG